MSLYQHRPLIYIFFSLEWGDAESRMPINLRLTNKARPNESKRLLGPIHRDQLPRVYMHDHLKAHGRQHWLQTSRLVKALNFSKLSKPRLGQVRFYLGRRVWNIEMELWSSAFQLRRCRVGVSRIQSIRLKAKSNRHRANVKSSGSFLLWMTRYQLLFSSAEYSFEN